MFHMILTHLGHEGKQVECMSAGSVPLEVGDQRPRFEVRVKFDDVPQFPHSCVLNDAEDEVHSLSPCRLPRGSIHSMRSVLCLHFRPHRRLSIVRYRLIVGADPFRNNERLSVSASVSRFRVYDPDNIFIPLRLIERDWSNNWVRTSAISVRF